jgi:hypothetical protein
MDNGQGASPFQGVKPERSIVLVVHSYRLSRNLK